MIRRKILEIYQKTTEIPDLDTRLDVVDEVQKQLYDLEKLRKYLTSEDL